MSGGGALTLDRVSKVYDTARGSLPAVTEISVEIEPGEFHVLVGPSGCGKTTLLNAIAGFHHITAGRIELDGKLLCGDERPQSTPGADRVMVFQHSTLFPWLSVLDNVIYGPVVQRRKSRRDARVLGRSQLQRAGLAPFADRLPAELSSGIQRRVEIVRALINEPRVLLLDEPFRGMDGLTRSVMHEALLELHARAGTTVVFITHDIDEAVFLGSKVSVLTSRPGRIAATVDVDLPRPRTAELLSSARFADLVAEVLRAIRGGSGGALAGEPLALEAA